MDESNEVIVVEDIIVDAILDSHQKREDATPHDTEKQSAREKLASEEAKFMEILNEKKKIDDAYQIEREKLEVEREKLEVERQKMSSGIANAQLEAETERMKLSAQDRLEKKRTIIECCKIGLDVSWRLVSFVAACKFGKTMLDAKCTGDMWLKSDETALTWFDRIINGLGTKKI